MDFLDILKEKAFLGREFLTWLWFKSDRAGGMVEIPGKRTIELSFLDKMTLDLSGSESPQMVTIKGGQSELREGMAALKEGKKIEEARILIRDSQEEYTVTIKGTWLSFSGFRTPPAFPTQEGDADDSEGAFHEKMYLVEQFLTIIDELFAFFLEMRVSDAWEKTELPLLRKWVESSGQ
jgi:recombination associated protein RdgC